MKIKSMYITILCVCSSLAVIAQSHTGEGVSSIKMATSIPGIYGFVKDSLAGEHLANATVILNGIPMVPQVISDSSGIYFFQQIPAGTVALMGDVPTYFHKSKNFTYNGHLKFIDLSLLHSVPLTGQITYENTQSTPLNNIKMYLKDNNTNEIVDSTLSDATGSYSLEAYQGDFKIIPQCTKPWGGVNSVDAMLILKHFVGQNHLTGNYLLAADVNASGTVNSSDALTDTKRFVNQIFMFASGDWMFDKPVFHITEGMPIVRAVKGLCFGDVNGSYIPIIE